MSTATTVARSTQHAAKANPLGGLPQKLEAPACAGASASPLAARAPRFLLAAAEGRKTQPPERIGRRTASPFGYAGDLIDYTTIAHTVAFDDGDVPAFNASIS